LFLAARRQKAALSPRPPPRPGFFTPLLRENNTPHRCPGVLSFSICCRDGSLYMMVFKRPKKKKRKTKRSRDTDSWPRSMGTRLFQLHRPPRRSGC
jgi:hypothetical protein